MSCEGRMTLHTTWVDLRSAARPDAALQWVTKTFANYKTPQPPLRTFRG